MIKEFTRENRYLVIKRTDLEAALELMEPMARNTFINLLDCVETSISIIREARDRGPLHCVVIESDWPEYEPTWIAIEKRVAQEEAEGFAWGREDCPVTRAPCNHYYYQCDNNGEVAINYCANSNNPTDSEGNCIEALCPLIQP